MRKVIAALNVTLDGYCDHTASFYADDELHNHYAALLQEAGMLLYGRTTYELMQFWQNILNKPVEEAALTDFALAIDRVEKLVFSRTLTSTGWHSARLAKKPLFEEVAELKKQPGAPLFVGSRSLINQLLAGRLIDELQLCIHPLTLGKGLPLFEPYVNEIHFKHKGSKTLSSGAVVLIYTPKEQTINR